MVVFRIGVPSDAEIKPILGCAVKLVFLWKPRPYVKYIKKEHMEIIIWIEHKNPNKASEQNARKYLNLKLNS